jgi:uncharacterized membrane protein YfcA
VAASIAVGLVAGLMSGVFGVGGGVVLVPGLAIVLGLTQHRAHATSLAAIILTATAGAAGFASQGSIDMEAAGFTAGGAVVGALLGAQIMTRISPSRLRLSFAILLIAVSVQLVIGAVPQGDADLPGLAPLWFAVLGVAAGALSSVMGVGGGVILVPALVLLFGYSQQIAEGTSLAIIVPTAVAGSVQHARHGHTDWRTGLVVGSGGIIGALGGSAVAHLVDAAVLQRLFGALLLLVGGQLLIRTLRARRA